MIICPGCGHTFMNRQWKACPKCHVRILKPGEWGGIGDWFITPSGYQTYEMMLEDYNRRGGP